VRPALTIGMPVYNGEQFIRRSLDSLLAQSFREFELLVSDNASTDGTSAILQEYAARDPRIILRRQDCNIGALANFRYVLNEASGNYFMWASADDWWERDHVAGLFQELSDHADCVAAMSATVRYKSDGAVFDVVRYAGRKNPNLISSVRLAFLIAGGGLYHFYIYGMFNTAFLRRVIDNMPNVKGADRQFICQIALAAKVRYVDRLSYMRQTYTTPAVLRYRSSDAKLSAIYSDLFGMYKSAWSFGPYLFHSPEIPARRKLWIPLLVARYALFVVENSFRGAIRFIGRSFAASRTGGV
jgi:glycosyltransferase involved in cell wall biosynthesis